MLWLYFREFRKWLEKNPKSATGTFGKGRMKNTFGKGKNNKREVIAR